MKKMLVLIFIILGLPAWVFAGDIDSPGVPSAGSGMYTLQQLYNYLDLGTEPPIPGSFQEPSAGPGPTMKTTKNIYDDTKAKFDQCDAQASDVAAGKKFFSTQDSSWGVQTGTGDGGSSAAVPKTGQTICYDASGNVILCTNTGQDGDLQKGVASPSPRFIDNNDGTVTDNLTGLMWTKSANAAATRTWTQALTYCNNLELGGFTDWRLPNVKELLSLIDFGAIGPSLPSGAPFTNVQSSHYWSSSTYVGNKVNAWYVNISASDVFPELKTIYNYVWPVRGGQ